MFITTNHFSFSLTFIRLINFAVKFKNTNQFFFSEYAQELREKYKKAPNESTMRQNFRRLLRQLETSVCLSAKLRRSMGFRWGFLNVRFAKKFGRSGFKWPPFEDISVVDRSEVQSVLPEPHYSGK